MEASDRSLLKRNRVSLAKQLDIVEVAQILIGENILSDRMLEEINTNTSNFSRNVAFLNKLPTRGPRAFKAFYDALIETDQEHLAHILIPPDENTSLGNLGNVACLSTIPNPPPSSFSFSESIPFKNSSSNASFNISSIAPTTPKTCFIQPPDPLKMSPPSYATSSSPAPASLPSEGEPARVPIEHMDVSAFDDDFRGQSSSEGGKYVTVSTSIESLRSNASIEFLKTAAGITESNHSQCTAADNNHIEVDKNGNRFQQLCMDAPRWENVEVRHTSTEFLQDHMDDCYSMFGMCKGIVLLVNVTKFEPSACLDDRLGGEKDCARLELMFKQLSYDVYKLINGTAAEIWNTLSNFAAWPKLKEYESCFIMVMSHGEDGVIFGRDGQRVFLKEAFNLFSNENCPHLQNKPKVFLIQACRGNQPDKGTDQIDAPNTKEAGPISSGSKSPKRRRLDFGGPQAKNKLPTMSDCLIAYATVPGYAAMRNTESGSWFIQAFIQVVAFHARNNHLSDLMTMTNNQVKGREGWSPNSEFHRCKEMSEFTSCLCKPLYFFPGIYLKRVST